MCSKHLYAISVLSRFPDGNTLSCLHRNNQPLYSYAFSKAESLGPNNSRCQYLSENRVLAFPSFFGRSSNPFSNIIFRFLCAVARLSSGNPLELVWFGFGSCDMSEQPFLPPPRGIVPNYTNPHSIGQSLTITCSIFLVIMIVFVMIRIYTKSRIMRKFTWDDSMYPPPHDESCR